MPLFCYKAMRMRERQLLGPRSGAGEDAGARGAGARGPSERGSTRFGVTAALVK